MWILLPFGLSQASFLPLVPVLMLSLTTWWKWLYSVQA